MHAPNQIWAKCQIIMVIKNCKFFHSNTRLSSVAPCSAITFHLLCFFFGKNSLLLFWFKFLASFLVQILWFFFVRILCLFFHCFSNYHDTTNPIQNMKKINNYYYRKVGKCSNKSVLPLLQLCKTVIQYNSFKVSDI